MTYTEAVAYVRQIQTGAKIKPGLRVPRSLMKWLGNPQDGLNFIHIAGTNGKGSTASFLSSIYAESGLKVGRYISPVVFTEFEKIQYEQAGEKVMITEDEMAECLTEIMRAVKHMRDLGEGIPTEFEIETAAAFLMFARWNCDLVVLETGMGGKLDATNIIRTAECVVITPIAMDHMYFLGDTIEEITAHKAGIIKRNVPVVSSQHDDRAACCLAEACNKLGCEFQLVSQKDIQITEASISGIRFAYKKHKKLNLSMSGLYQAENACLALECVEKLQSRYPVSEEHIADGLRHANWRGRFELVQKEPVVVVDGAHNPDGMRQFLASVHTHFEGYRKIGIMGVFADKDYETMIDEMGGTFSEMYTVTPPSERGLPAEKLAEEIMERLGGEVQECLSVAEALLLAEKNIREKTAVFVFGSLSLVKSTYDFLDKKDRNVKNMYIPYAVKGENL